jgi:hypothetical protein
MVRRAQPASAWIALFRAERNGLVLTRLRWCLALGLVGMAVWGLEVLALPVVARGLRTEYLLTYAAVWLGVWTLTTVPVVRSHATGLALSYIVPLTFGITRYLGELPDGPAIAPAVLTLVLLGTTLLVPWGLGPELIVAAVTMASYVALHAMVPGGQISSGVPVVVLAGTVAAAGAYLIDRYRARLFVGHPPSVPAHYAARTLVAATVRGSVTVNTVPRPSALWTRTVPPSIAVSRCTRWSPTPTPPPPAPGTWRNMPKM